MMVELRIQSYDIVPCINCVYWDQLGGLSVGKCTKLNILMTQRDFCSYGKGVNEYGRNEDNSKKWIKIRKSRINR